MNQTELLTKCVTALEIPITEQQVNLFLTYSKFLLEYNEKINLTTITAPDEIITKHFVDSISVLKALESENLSGLKIADIGTGAGFPGVPLKIMCPELELTLVDSLNKRLIFLNELVELLNLDGVFIKHSRAEDLGKLADHRECYDVVVSRAVSNLSVLAEYCLPLTKVGGKFISMKGPDTMQEITTANAAIKVLGGQKPDVKTIKIPFTDITHTLVIVGKLQHTPTAYPRKATNITKTPIS